MKKLLFSIFTVFTVLSFSSCDLLMQLLLKTDIEPVEFSVKEKGDTYFVKYMMKPGYYYTGRASGYVSEARGVIDEITEDITDLPKIGGSELNNTDIITELNKKIDTMMAKETRAVARSVSCSTEIDTSYVGQTRKFWIMKTTTDDKQIQVQRNAVCKYSGDHCNVWFIDNYNGLPKDFTSADFAALGEKFDTLYESETAVVGSTIYNAKSADYYIDPRNKVQILLLDCMEDAYENMLGGTFGYFYGMDVFEEDYVYEDEDTGETTTYYTNSDFIIYLDSLFYSYDGSVTIEDDDGNSYLPKSRDAMYSTIAHEFNHLLNYIQKQIVNGVQENETWFTEMLAMTMEDFFMDLLDVPADQSSRNRLYYYFNNYHSFGPTTWFSGDNVYISYANAFALGAFLSRNYGGADFIHEIATSNKGGISAINAALAKFGYDEEFEDVIKKMPNILINTSTSGVTLNKSGNSSKFKNVKISPINLINETEIDGKIYTYKPNILDKRAFGTDLYPYGYSIYSVGKNVSKITYQPTSEDYASYLEFEVIVK